MPGKGRPSSSWDVSGIARGLNRSHHLLREEDSRVPPESGAKQPAGSSRPIDGWFAWSEDCL